MILLSRASDPKAGQTEQHVVRMKLEGAATPRSFEGLEPAESTSNYLIGSDRAKWVTKAPNYRKIRASEVYEGIDLVYYGNGRQLEYDFVVKPGADPGCIRLAYDGADRLSTDEEGRLHISTGKETVVQHRPVVYQDYGGERRKVEASYKVRGAKVEFLLARYDRQRELVIDPTLEYSTFFGGASPEIPSHAMATDSSGAIYLAGYTSSASFPVSGAYQPAIAGGIDVVVTKLAAGGGSVVYSTYLGGMHDDSAFAIAVDGTGAAWLTGETGPRSLSITTNNFPITTGPPFAGVKDAFVAQLAPSGASLVVSRYLGGDNDDHGFGIAVDANAVYVGGYTHPDFGTPFPTTASALQPAIGDPSGQASGDGFFTKFDRSGTIQYSTFLGGAQGDRIHALAVSNGVAYVTGLTDSDNFPNASPANRGGGVDAFVASIDPAQTGLAGLRYSTYLGGALTREDTPLRWMAAAMPMSLAPRLRPTSPSPLAPIKSCAVEMMTPL